MGLIEFNKLWAKLKQDLFKDVLEKESQKVQGFVIDRRMRQAEVSNNVLGLCDRLDDKTS